MRRTRSLLTATLLALPLAGCPSIFGPTCEAPHVRQARVAGDLHTSVGFLGTATFTVDQIRQGGVLSRLSRNVAGLPQDGLSPLRGRVTRAQLVAEDGTVVLEVPTALPAGVPAWVVIAGDSALNAGEAEHLRTQFTSTPLALRLETSVAGLETVRVPLTAVRSTEWNQEGCAL